MIYANNIDNYNIIWTEINNSVSILRVYGESDTVIIPEYINNLPVTTIADYCFSETRHLPDSGDTTLHASDYLTELCGDNIKQIILPDTVTKIGNYAFYNCRNLNTMEFGKNTVDFGSDVFMNCSHLETLNLRCSISEKSGARQFLSHISTNIVINFMVSDDTYPSAAVLFPEYFEIYEEIAPAHIFGLNVSGEGFRARQCFNNDIMDIVQYDSIFAKACVEENEDTLCEMALDRLYTPYNLSTDARKLYEEYIIPRIKHVGSQLLNHDRIDLLEFICRAHYAASEDISEYINISANLNNPKYTAKLIKIKNELYPVNSVKSRYSFDDFE